MILRSFNMPLRCPAHDIVLKLREFESDINTYRQMYSDYTEEEIFIESNAYMTLIGAAQHIDTVNISLRKFEGTCVGSMFGINARSGIFTPVKVRDDEGVPTLNIQYRMLG